MFNAQVAGHLGKDPETRITPSGKKVTTFSLAVNSRKGKEDITFWVRVTVWGDHLEKIISHLKKGSGVIVTGRMMPPTIYQDKEGKSHVSLEMTAEMIDFNPFGKSDRTGSEGPTMVSSNNAYRSPSYEGSGGQSYSRSPSYGGAEEHHAPEDDSLPF